MCEKCKGGVMRPDWPANRLRCTTWGCPNEIDFNEWLLMREKNRKIRRKENAQIRYDSKLKRNIKWLFNKLKIYTKKCDSCGKRGAFWNILSYNYIGPDFKVCSNCMRSLSDINNKRMVNNIK